MAGSASAAGPGARPDDQATVDAAKQEGGSVTFYSSAVSLVLDDVLNAFKNQYGITVDASRVVTGVVNQRFTAENQAGKVVADVIANTDNSFLDQASSSNWLMNLATLPSFVDWPKQFFMTTYAVLSYQGVGIAWNTSLVPEGLTAWSDLLNPKYRGQIALSDPHSGAASMANFVFFRQVYGDDWLRQLATQNFRVLDSSVTVAQQVAAGAVAIGFPMPHTSLAPMTDQGAPVADTVPSPTIGAYTYAAAAANAPHPNSARLLMNFLAKRDTQKLINKQASSPIPNLEGTIPGPTDIRQPDVVEAARQDKEISALLGLGT